MSQNNFSSQMRHFLMLLSQRCYLIFFSRFISLYRCSTYCKFSIFVHTYFLLDEECFFLHRIIRLSPFSIGHLGDMSLSSLFSSIYMQCISQPDRERCRESDLGRKCQVQEKNTPRVWLQVCQTLSRHRLAFIFAWHTCFCSFRPQRITSLIDTIS